MKKISRRDLLKGSLTFSAVTAIGGILIGCSRSRPLSNLKTGESPAAAAASHWLNIVLHGSFLVQFDTTTSPATFKIRAPQVGGTYPHVYCAALLDQNANLVPGWPTGTSNAPYLPFAAAPTLALGRGDGGYVPPATATLDTVLHLPGARPAGTAAFEITLPVPDGVTPLRSYSFGSGHQNVFNEQQGQGGQFAGLQQLPLLRLVQYRGLVSPATLSQGGNTWQLTPTNGVARLHLHAEPLAPTDDPVHVQMAMDALCSLVSPTPGLKFLAGTGTFQPCDDSTTALGAGLVRNEELSLGETSCDAPPAPGKGKVGATAAHPRNCMGIEVVLQ